MPWATSIRPTARMLWFGLRLGIDRSIVGNAMGAKIRLAIVSGGVLFFVGFVIASFLGSLSTPPAATLSIGDAEPTDVLATLQVYSMDFDPVSGLPTGRLRHLPIKVTKAVDSTSIALLKALDDSWRLPDVTLDYFRIHPATGVRVKDYTVVLTDVVVVSVETFLPDAPLPKIPDSTVLEHVEFAYQDLVVSYNGRAPATGDANSDWQVDLRDALVLQRCAGATSPAREDCIGWYDFDRDGTITAGDQTGFNAVMTGP